MRVNIQSLLEFFDNPKDGKSKHATSLVSIIGEDLSAALFKHYMVNVKNADVELQNGKVKKKGKKGHWLDRWILVKTEGKIDVPYQVEIKSWSAHSLGGEALALNAAEEEMRNYRIKHWETIEVKSLKKFFSAPEDQKHRYAHISKVLTKMNPPEGIKDEHIKPLLIYWISVHPMGENECFFEFPLNAYQNNKNDCHFEILYVFSVSSYLRMLLNDKKYVIELELNDINERINLLKSFFPSV